MKIWKTAYLNEHEPAAPREHYCRHEHHTPAGAAHCCARIARAAREAHVVEWGIRRTGRAA